MCAPDVIAEIQTLVTPEQPQGEIRFGKPQIIRLSGDDLVREQQENARRNRKFNIPKQTRKDI